MICLCLTGTSTGMTINNIDFIKSSHNGLVISDVTSAAFIEDLPWEKIDVSVFCMAESTWFRVSTWNYCHVQSNGAFKKE